MINFEDGFGPKFVSYETLRMLAIFVEKLSSMHTVQIEDLVVCLQLLQISTWLHAQRAHGRSIGNFI